MITVLVSASELAGERVEVSGERYRHLFRARRAEIGEAVRVVDGAGVARSGVVEVVGKTRGTLLLGEASAANDPVRRVELWVAPPKPERAAWMVEKASELGVAAVRFVATARAPRDYGSAAFERLRRVAVAGLEQSHGARLPEITGMHAWSECLERAAIAPWRAVLEARGGAFGDLPVSGGSAAAALLVGPEGGFSEPELAELASRGVPPWSLGVRALRVETAAVVAAALLLAP